MAVFTPKPLTEEQIQALLENADAAGSNANAQTSGEKTRDVPPIATTATRGIGGPGSVASANPGVNQQPVVRRFSFVHAGR